MNLFSRIKKMFGIEELSKVLLKHETLEPDNDYVTRQIVMAVSYTHLTLPTKRIV